MDDLISRSALLQDIEEAVVFTGRPSRNAEICGANKIIDRIKAASAVDAVEVVRCKDCECFNPITSNLGCCKDSEKTVSKLHYCSYGERKTNEND